MYWNRGLDTFGEESKRLIQSEHGILLRLNRSIQVEGCFASFEDQRGHRRLRHYGRERSTWRRFTGKYWSITCDNSLENRDERTSASL